MTVHAKKLIVRLCLTILALLGSAHASGPALISYQGRLVDTENRPVTNGSHDLVFSLFADSTDGEALWSESGQVVTVDGLFDHRLGSVTPLPADIFTGESLFLEITVAGEIISPRTRLTSAPHALNAGGLRVTDADDSLAIATSGNNRSLTLYDSEGAEKVILRGLDGDTAVILPEGSISAPELLDEPGIAVNTNIHAVPLITTIMSDLVRVDITTPADGYILLLGKCYLLLSGTTGPNTAQVQIDEAVGGGTQFPYYAMAGLSGYVNTGTNYFPIFVQRAYYKKAGSYEFRMEARASYALPARAECWDHVLIAVYYPTQYEAVKAILSSGLGLPGAIPFEVDRSDPDESGQYYEIDLRQLRPDSSASKQ